MALPRLTPAERARRARVARKVLLPAAIRKVGAVGFTEMVRRLRKYEDRIREPERLVGWLKGQAKRMGVLAPEHAYVGRKGYRKYPAAAARKTPAEYRAYLREMRLRKRGLAAAVRKTA